MIEEFLTGQEGSYDSVMVDGQLVWDSISAYLPTPLEVLRNPWMQWVVLLPRDIDGPEYAEIKKIAPHALRALGLETGLSHMEWFRRPDGFRRRVRGRRPAAWRPDHEHAVLRARLRPLHRLVAAPWSTAPSIRPNAVGQRAPSTCAARGPARSARCTAGPPDPPR